MIAILKIKIGSTYSLQFTFAFITTTYDTVECDSTVMHTAHGTVKRDSAVMQIFFNSDNAPKREIW